MSARRGPAVARRLDGLSRDELLTLAAEALRAAATLHNAPLHEQCDAMTLCYRAEDLARTARRSGGKRAQVSEAVRGSR